MDEPKTSRRYDGNDPAVTQFRVGDSAMVKMLKVARWALLRGGRFKAPELMARFGCSRSMAYAYYYAWRSVFGDKPPPRAYHPVLQPGADTATDVGTDKPKPSLDSLIG